MTDSGDISILRRKLAVSPETGPPMADGAMTPERVLRLAVEKAVDQAIGLAVTVTDVAVSVVGLDELIGALARDDLLVSVDGRDGPAGLIGADAQTVIAIVERATMGRLAAAVPVARGLTGTDLALVQPVLAAILGGLPVAAVGSDLAGWADGYGLAARLPGPRAAGLILAEGGFRLVRFELDFAVAGRVGTLTLALPAQRGVRTVSAKDVDAGQWAQQMRQSVLAAPAELVAVLHRMRLPLRAVESFSVGQLIALDGTTVGSVRLEGPDGASFAQARLGQAAGLRAVRIQGAVAMQMRDGGVGTRAATPPNGVQPGAVLIE